MEKPEPDNGRQSEEDDAVHRRFAELMRRFWARPKDEQPNTGENKP
jgi:hypothetical protein